MALQPDLLHALPGLRDAVAPAGVDAADGRRRQDQGLFFRPEAVAAEEGSTARTKVFDIAREKTRPSTSIFDSFPMRSTVNGKTALRCMQQIQWSRLRNTKRVLDLFGTR